MDRRILENRSFLTFLAFEIAACESVGILGGEFSADVALHVMDCRWYPEALAEGGAV